MPDTVQDLIRQAAADNGIPASLALAVAEQESGFNPTLVNPKQVKTPAGEEHAIGTFQFLPSTAKTLGIDPTDPRQNITGGAKYLRQLMDKHGGDLKKVISEYGGVKADQVYVPSVMTRLAKFQGAPDATVTPQPSTGGRGGAGPVGTGGAGRASGAGPGPDPNTITADYPDPRPFLKKAVAAFDPRTPEGRVNLASTAGTIGLTYATGGTSIPVEGAAAAAPQVAGWIARILGPPVAAAVAGGGERGIEQAIGTTPKEATGPVETGLTQGAYEVLGQMFMWLPTRLAKTWFAGDVSRAAKAGLEAHETATAQAGRATVSAVKDRAAQNVEAARMLAQAHNEAIKESVIPDVENVARNAVQQRIRVAGKTTAQVDAAKRLASAQLADTELNNVARLRNVTQQYDALLNAPPSNSATADAVGNVVSSGTRTGTEKGAAQIALDQAGKRVAAAAETGPPIKLGPVQDALEAMRAAGFPDELIQAPTKKGAGFLDNVAARAKGAPGGETMSREEFNRQLASTAMEIRKDALAGAETPQLPKVLGLIQRAPVDDIQFSTAHKLKGLLDDAVDWDSKANNKLQGITKGVRIALRRAMADAGNVPYEEATAAYAKVIPLYEGKIGQQIIKSVQENPDALAKTLNVDAPILAKRARQLLVDQSAAGGDPTGGLKAWDAVRAAFTHKNLVEGGADGLEQRVQDLVTQHPEFAKEVYHDVAGQQILTNLSEIGKAVRIAKEESAAALAGAKTAGATAVTEAKRTAAQTTATFAEDIRLNAARLKREAMAPVREAQAQGASTVRDVSRQGAEATTEAQRLTAEANARVDEAIKKFRASSVASPRDVPSHLRDVAVAASGSHTSKAWAITRLLSGPKANDILEWAAFSPKNTQRLTSALMGRGGDRLFGSVMRDIGTVVMADPKAAPTSTGR